MNEDHNTESRKPESRDTDEFLKRVKTTLDNAADEIDGATQTRLRALRREAIAAREKSYLSTWWAPAGGLATIATLMVLIVSLWTPTPDESVFMPPLEDIALLTDKDDPEFYEELEFYLWLGNEPSNGMRFDDQRLNNTPSKKEKSVDEQQTG